MHVVRSLPTVGRVLVLLIVLAGLAPAGMARAQQSTIKDTIYISPGWGFSVRWHYDDWIVDADIVSPGSNTLGLRDDEGNYLLFSSQQEFNGDAEACLDELILAAGESPDATLPVAATSEGEPFESRGPNQSYVVYQTTAPDDTGDLGDVVVYVECQTLIPGDAVLIRQYTGSPEAFMQSYDAIVDVLESVHHPWATASVPEDDADARFVDAGYSPLRDEYRYSPNLFPYPGEGVTSTLHLDLVDQAGATRVITFRNISDAPVTVEPANLSLVLIPLFEDTEAIVQPATSITWEDGVNANPDGSRILEPGESATVHARIPSFDPAEIDCDSFPLILLEYGDSGGQSTSFGDVDDSNCFPSDVDPRPVL